MPNFDGSIIIGTTVDVGGINSGLHLISNQFRKLAKLTGGGMLKGVFQRAIDEASDLVEIQNVVDVTFDSMVYKAELFGNIATEKFGMSELMAKRVAGSFMAMGRAMDLDMENASNMAVKLAALTGDFASFYNISQDYARLAMSAIYTGETKTLKRYGIVLTEANLQQFANNKGIEASVKKMSARDKLILRYMYVTENLKFVEGDFLRTQESWANQTRLLGETWRNFLIVLGNGLTTVFAPVLKMINQIIGAMGRLMTIILSIVHNIYGIDFSKLSGGVSDYADDLADAVEEEEDMADAVTAAGKAAMKAIQPFDELNVLRTPSSSGKSPTPEIFADFEIPDPTADWLGKVDEDLTSLIDNMYDFGRWIATGFEDLLKKIPWEEIFKVAKKVGQDASDFLNGLFKPSMFANLGKTVANGLNTILYTVQTFVHNLDWAQIGESISEFINNFFSTYDFTAAADTINTFIKGLWTLIGTLIEKTDWKMIKENITNFFKQIDWETWATVIGAGLFLLITSRKVRNLVKSAFSLLFHTILSVSALKNLLGSVSISGLAGVINGFLMKLLGITITPIEDIFVSNLGLPGEIATTMFTPNPKVLAFWETLKSIFESIAGFVSKMGSWFIQANTLDLGAIFAEGTFVEIGFTIGLGIIEGIIAAIAGYFTGKDILGPLLAPDDKELYKNFKMFGEGGFFDTLFEADWKTIGTSIHDMLTDLDGIAVILSPTISSILRLIDAIKNNDVVGIISSVIDTIINIALPVVGLLFTMIETLINTVAKWITGEGITNLKFALLEFIVEKFTAIKDFITEKLSEIGSAIYDKLEPVITFVQGAVEFIGHILQGVFILIKAGFITVMDFVKAQVEAGVAHIKVAIGSITNVVLAIKNVIVNIVKTIWGAYQQFNDWLFQYTEKIFDFIVNVFTIVKDKFVAVVTQFCQGINTLFGLIFNFLVKAKDDFVADVTYAYNQFKAIFIDPITSALTTFIGFVNTTVVEPFKQGFIDAFTVIKTEFEKFVGSLESGAKGLANTIIGAFETLINAVIDNGINKFLSLFNSVVTKAAEKTGDNWTNIPDVSLVRIPRLAKGAVIPPNSPFLAMLGDQRNGTNIETPLDTIKQAVAEVVASSGFGGGNDIIVQCVLDGREIARAVVKQNDIFKKSTGRNMI